MILKHIAEGSDDCKFTSICISNFCFCHDYKKETQSITVDLKENGKSHYSGSSARQCFCVKMDGFECLISCPSFLECLDH